MTSVEDKIKYYKENMELFDDDMDKYKYLLDQAKNAKPFPEEFRQDSLRLMVAKPKSGLFHTSMIIICVFIQTQMPLFQREW